MRAVSSRRTMRHALQAAAAGETTEAEAIRDRSEWLGLLLCH